MRDSKQSAVVNGNSGGGGITVNRRSRSATSAGGLCDCFRQPRRVRPLPFKSKEYEMVETRPGRLIRVLHLLPAKRSRKPKAAAETTRLSGVESNGTHHTIHQQQPSLANIKTTTSETAAVQAEINTRHTNGGAVVEEVAVLERNEEGEENADEISLNDDEDKCRFSPIYYGFENPFHPKNFLYREDDDAYRINVFAEHLAATILDDALLELGTLWRLILPPNLDEKFREDGRCFFLDDDFEDINYHTWSSAGDAYQLNGSLHGDKSFQRSSVRDWDGGHGVDNPSFEMAGFRGSESDIEGELPASLVNGGNHVSSFNNYRYPSASSPCPVRSSFSSCNGGHNHRDSKVSVSRTVSKNSHTKQGDEIDANLVDQVFRIYRRPGGDEISSQPSTSFQSSTLGSSANSSLRFIRRYASRRFKTKPLMYFIHGVGDSADLWRRQLEFFQEKGYETVAWDLIGHGLSSAPDKSKAYTFDVILTDALVLFDRYSRDRNVIVGHAYGCCFAAALARLRPKQVAHLIMISGGGPFPLYPHPPKICLPACLLDCFRSLKSCGTRREMYYVPYRKQTRPIDGFDLPSYVVKHMIGGQVWLEGDASFHKQITIPTLLIYGLKDPYVNLVEECEMEKTIPRAFLELVPEASHMVMLETPDQVNDMMYKFLRRWSR